MQEQQPHEYILSARIRANEVEVMEERRMGLRFAVKEVQGRWILFDCEPTPAKRTLLPRFIANERDAQLCRNVLNAFVEASRGYDVAGLEHIIRETLAELPQSHRMYLQTQTAVLALTKPERFVPIYTRIVD